MNISVGIDSSFQFSDEMEVPLLNALQTWTQSDPTNNNVLLGAANNIPAGQVDFESVAIHELGHALGLSHPNLGDTFLAGDNYTTSTDGANNTFDVNPGADGIVGSADDLRGDDVNLNWFRKSNNNPFSIDTVVDSTTYSRDLADLPGGDLYSTNPDRTVADQLFGLANTEAVMQQGGVADSARRTLGFDDVAGIRYGMSGKDEIQGTADDYTINLVYTGFTDQADILLSMDLNSGAFTQNNFLVTPDKHISVLQSFVHFSFNENWFFSTCSSCSTATWDGSSGNWSNATKWDTNPVFPDNNEIDYDVTINGGVVTLDQNISVGSVELGASSGNASTLQILSSTLESDQISVGTAIGSIDQAVEVEGTGQLNVKNYLTIGDEGMGEVSISSGGQATTGAVYVGRQTGSSGTLTISGANSSLDVATDLVIGLHGSGTLRIENAANFSSTSGAFIGHRAGSNGEVIVTGTDSSWQMSGNLSLQGAGNGSLTVEQGGNVATSGQVDIGGAVGAIVNLNARDPNSTLTSDSWLILSSGNMLVENEGQVSTGRFSEIAGVAGQSATVTVSGTNSHWTVAEHLFVGSRGTGSLTIENGGQVTSGFGFNGLRLGWQAGSEGTLTVRGNGSQLMSTGPITVGDEGNGTLLIETGADVSTGDVVSLGANGSAIGNATIRDPGSQLSMNQFLIVNNGAMAVENGGAVDVTRFTEIASTFGKSAQMHVRGNSLWTVGEHLFVGSRGNGQLTIEDGGVVYSGFGFGGFRIGWVGGSEGSVTVRDDGSQLMTSGPISVGDGGNGSLLVKAGGHASTTNDVYLAVHGGTTGMATISGVGSQLSVSGSLYVGGNSGGAGGTGSLTVNDDAELIVGNTVRVYAGDSLNLQGGNVITNSLDLSPGGAFNFTGGILHANSVIGNLTNQGGTLAPGNSAGTTNILGNFTQSAGITEIELGGLISGTDYDFLSVTGTGVLGGQLELAMLGDFIPNPIDTFTVMAASVLSGLYDNVVNGQRLITRGGEGSFLVNYDGISNAVVLSSFKPIMGQQGDFDNDGDIDGADFLEWQRGESPDPFSSEDLTAWQASFGTTSGLRYLNLPRGFF